jgi:phosphoglycolate phosphatase-like HAD superfamily hydrolase
MVGDSASDVIAARAAGVRVAAVVWDPFARGKASLPDPDFSFASVADFSAFLGTAFPHHDGAPR